MLTYKRKSTFPVRETKTIKAAHFAPPDIQNKGNFMVVLMFNKITQQTRQFHYKIKVTRS